MKQLLAIILVVILIATVAVAEDHGEILFRDIPWGITLDEYIGKLEADGMQISLVLPTKSGCTVSLVNANPEAAFKVAGYEAYTVNVDSVYAIVNETIDPNPLNSIVYSASYTLLLDNDEEEINDLRQKLSNLYGKETILNQYWSIESYLWNGDNDTAVELKTGLVRIVYTDNSIKSHLKEVDAIVYRESVDLEGL